MTKVLGNEHEVNPAWRQLGADLYDAYVRAIEDLLEHVDDLHDLFKFLEDTETCEELRKMRSMLKSKANDLSGAANQMKAGINE